MHGITSTAIGVGSTLGFSGALSKGVANQEKIKNVAEEFEAVFMGQMLKPMWEGLETNELFGGGPGEDVMKDLLVQEYGKAMVKSDGGRLSSTIVEAMIRMQEVADYNGKSGGAHG